MIRESKQEKELSFKEGKYMKKCKVALEKILPAEIEQRSFEIITEELGERVLDPVQAPVIKRVIHTTADFDYVDHLYFSEGVVKYLQNALKNGAYIVTDTQMARSGINKRELAKYGGKVFCFMSDDDVAENAKRNKTTRAVASMDKASSLSKQVIFAIGNAPTALVRLYELMKEEKIDPIGIIAVPVGFVNVVESKELIIKSGCPCIVARGRKGGSNVAAAIVNALLYEMRK